MRLLLALSSLAAAQPALDARLEAMQASIDALTRTVSAQATELAALKADWPLGGAAGATGDRGGEACFLA